MIPEYLYNAKLKTSSNDLDDFKAVYKFFKPKLFIIANSYVPSKEDAEEIVHDVLIKLWEKRGKLDVKSNYVGYIYSMTRNACLDYLRAHKNKLSKVLISDQQELWLNYNALSNDAYSTIIVNELQNLVDNAIADLPEKCQKVFIKSRVDGLGHKEISEELKISTKTVENHITRALRELRVVLKEYLPILFF
ncbi:RNA polymerase sigma-70 factor [Zobellia sp. 1_MG-2023]|uniref:RNA polymerase sigma-70 factor n=1 Tax=Zobellia sp. 1_MG-2023 TaxID=3062626 RepID=UPI0026E1D80C|nr:RNA polymerase sigma-70 factor [Zobellia sp. 1_MG-2023]MDO6819835.1 RNA polymerase sigma-70 factor [Zobellia sp. 1_MG-2023]